MDMQYELDRLKIRVDYLEERVKLTNDTLLATLAALSGKPNPVPTPEPIGVQWQKEQGTRNIEVCSK